MVNQLPMHPDKEFLKKPLDEEMEPLSEIQMHDQDSVMPLTALNPNAKSFVPTSLPPFCN